MRTLQRIFADEVHHELVAHPPRPGDPITDADIAHLPDPVRRYLHACGFVGRPHTWNARIEWRELDLKRSRDAAWIRLACHQFNALEAPTRLVLMEGRLAHVLPFEGRDKLQDGHGNMLIRLGKLVTVGDVTGPEIDASALVTWLAEAALLPSAVLRPAIRWEPVSDHAARAVWTEADLAVGGIFHFDGDDRCVRFDTADRWQDGHPPRRIPWSAELGGYRAFDDRWVPTEVSATWHEADGPFTYARGTIDEVRFNVTA